MIYVTADTHGYEDIDKLNNEAFRKIITPNDYLIIGGDYGAIWFGNIEIPCPKDFPSYLNPDNLDTINFDKMLLDWYESLPFTILFIDGNHENFDLLNSYPIEDWNGGKIHKIRNNVFHLMRGQVFIIDGIKIFTMGGAESVDKHTRKMWWQEELPTWDECNMALDKLEEHNWTVDYIITHCLPDNKIPYYYRHNIITNLLFSIDKQANFKHWYCGHYHYDKQLDEKHTVLYQKIRSIDGKLIFN